MLRSEFEAGTPLVPGVLLLWKSLSILVHSSFTNPSQDFFSSSLSAVTFSGLKNSDLLKILEFILVERYRTQNVFSSSKISN